MLLQGDQIDRETTALAYPAFHLDTAAVFAHYARGVAQPQPMSFDVVDVAGGYAIKFVKNPLLMLRGNTKAVVLHCKLQLPVALRQVNADFRGGLAVFQRIIL